MNPKKTFCAAIGLLLLATPLLYAQEAESIKSDTELAKQAQNPMADIINVPIQNNFSFGYGDDDGMQYVMNIQPVMPASLTEDWMLINRIIIPIVSNPSALGSKTGLGDIQYQGFIGPSKPKGITWGAGPVLSFPTATDSTLGPRKWSAGGGVVALKMQGPWVYGALVNNIWSYAGSGNNDVNMMTIQYFINYNFSDGWYVSSAPINTSNWEASSGNKWTIPVGGGVGKMIKLGKLPINLQLQAYYNIESPEIGPDWSMRFQIQTILPKSIFSGGK